MAFTTPAHRAPCILIVDDDEAVRDSLKILLESHGMTVETLESAEIFLAMPVSSYPDCLVLDLHLPGIGGLEVLRHLDANGITLPVVVITGQNTPAIRDHVMKTGARDYLEKPFAEDVLVHSIDRALMQHC